jgi:hypothetical protein
MQFVELKSGDSLPTLTVWAYVSPMIDFQKHFDRLQAALGVRNPSTGKNCVGIIVLNYLDYYSDKFIKNFPYENDIDVE